MYALVEERNSESVRDAKRYRAIWVRDASNRCHFSSKQLDRALHRGHFEGRRAHLESDASDAAERMACIQHLAGDGRWVADQKGAFRAAHRFELLALRCCPAPLPTHSRPQI